MVWGGGRAWTPSILGSRPDGYDTWYRLDAGTPPRSAIRLARSAARIGICRLVRYSDCSRVHVVDTAGYPQMDCIRDATDDAR